jgi:anti-anti-sigma factor
MNFTVSQENEMNISTSTHSNQARIRLSGRFDFNSHRHFKQACEGPLTEAAVGELVVDMAAVDYLDSSALGMLLILRDRGAAASKRVVIENCTGAVSDVLRIANFQKLFTMR